MNPYRAILRRCGVRPDYLVEEVKESNPALWKRTEEDATVFLKWYYHFCPHPHEPKSLGIIHFNFMKVATCELATIQFYLTTLRARGKVIRELDSDGRRTYKVAP